MSIENAVVEVLSSGDFDDLSPDIEDWNGVYMSMLEDALKEKGFYLYYREDLDIASGVIDSTLTARQHDQMQHYKAEAERADI